MSIYTVKEGECLVSIAQKNKMSLGKIWQDSNNSELRNKRKTPNLLYLGDKIFIPDFDKKEILCNSDNKHKFVKLGTPARLTININRNSKPLESVAFMLTIGRRNTAG